jgi:hypothetical protein
MKPDITAELNKRIRESVRAAVAENRRELDDIAQERLTDTIVAELRTITDEHLRRTAEKRRMFPLPPLP